MVEEGCDDTLSLLDETIPHIALTRTRMSESTCVTDVDLPINLIKPKSDLI